jgi:VanZ family protein
MKDERIETTVNRVAARGFIILYFLMILSLDYRVLILKQPLRDYWDFVAIWLIATLFGFVALASKGGFDYGFKGYWLKISVMVLIVVPTTLFLTGRIHSVAEVAAMLIGGVPAMGLVVGTAYFLNRRWKRKEGIEEEK